MVDFGPSQAPDISDIFYKTYNPTNDYKSPKNPGYLPNYAEPVLSYMPGVMDFIGLLPAVEVLKLPRHIVGSGTQNVYGKCYLGKRPVILADDLIDPYRVDVHENIHFNNTHRRESQTRFSEYTLLG